MSQNSWATPPISTRSNAQVTGHYRTTSVNANFNNSVEKKRNSQAFSIIPIHDIELPETPTLVTFIPDDPGNPKNWSNAFRWYCTMVVAFTCFVVAFNSSTVTADIPGVSREFSTTDEVSLLTVTLFVLGFGLGPLIFAPLSEVFGRQVIYTSTLLLALIFIIPAAVAPNIQTLLVARAIDGIAFSSPMTLVGGTLSDLWTAEERGISMAAFSAAPFFGTVIGPLAGGYMSMGHGWRWLYWLQLILAGAAWLLITFTVPETYGPTILARRAAKLRKENKGTSYTIKQGGEGGSLGQRLRVALVRPFQLLSREPVVFFIGIYMSVIYGLLYMFFVAYPIVYQSGKHYDAGTTGLMFIPFGIGILCGAAFSPLVNKQYVALCKKHHGKPPAEVRLIPMMVCCWLVPIGLFVFAWTSYPYLSWPGPAMGGFCFGFGFILLYNSANNYIVDSYQHQAASALAAKTLLRAIWGASTVLFTAQMYERLGLQWASSLLAFIALACCAIPFIFYIYGARIRRHSKYAFVPEEEHVVAEKMSTETVLMM